MGLVLDSSIVVQAERTKLPVSALLELLHEQHGSAQIVLSSISVVELEHGIFRAQTAQQAINRSRYLETVFLAIPVEPFTREIGSTAARIDAEARSSGHVISFADLLIGATALHFGFGLVTRNERHFV